MPAKVWADPVGGSIKVSGLWEEVLSSYDARGKYVSPSTGISIPGVTVHVEAPLSSYDCSFHFRPPNAWMHTVGEQMQCTALVILKIRLGMRILH
jgi:hypothetical protein